jgi:hypothetical protein
MGTSDMSKVLAEKGLPSFRDSTFLSGIWSFGNFPSKDSGVRHVLGINNIII